MLETSYIFRGKFMQNFTLAPPRFFFLFSFSFTQWHPKSNYLVVPMSNNLTNISYFSNRPLRLDHKAQDAVHQQVRIPPYKLRCGKPSLMVYLATSLNHPNVNYIWMQVKKVKRGTAECNFRHFLPCARDSLAPGTPLEQENPLSQGNPDTAKCTLIF